MASTKTKVEIQNGSTKRESWNQDPERSSKDKAHLEAMTIAASDSSPSEPLKRIELPPLDIRDIRLRIVGLSPLISHKWSEKAKKQILDKQMGKASRGRENKDPVADFEESLYVVTPAAKGQPFESGTFGFPAIAFKNAAVTACTSLGKSISKVAARQAFHVIGEILPIEGKPSAREDMVKVGMGTADIRYRGEFKEWTIWVHVRYNARVLTDEQIVNLFNIAGFAVGVGEWRPERDGNAGMFAVESVKRGD